MADKKPWERYAAPKEKPAGLQQDAKKEESEPNVVEKALNYMSLPGQVFHGLSASGATAPDPFAPPELQDATNGFQGGMRPEDLRAALEGRGHGMGTYLKRGNVPAAGYIGFVGDVMAPGVEMGLLSGLAPYVGRAGQGIYNSAVGPLKKAYEAAVNPETYGKFPTKRLINMGASGGIGKILATVQSKIDEAGSAVKAALITKGTKVPTSRASARGGKSLEDIRLDMEHFGVENPLAPMEEIGRFKREAKRLEELAAGLPDINATQSDTFRKTLWGMQSHGGAQPETSEEAAALIGRSAHAVKDLTGGALGEVLPGAQKAYSRGLTTEHTMIPIRDAAEALAGKTTRPITNSAVAAMRGSPARLIVRLARAGYIPAATTVGSKLVKNRREIPETVGKAVRAAIANEPDDAAPIETKKPWERYSK